MNLLCNSAILYYMTLLYGLTTSLDPVANTVADQLMNPVANTAI